MSNSWMKHVALLSAAVILVLIALAARSLWRVMAPAAWVPHERNSSAMPGTGSPGSADRFSEQSGHGSVTHLPTIVQPLDIHGTQSLHNPATSSNGGSPMFVPAGPAGGNPRLEPVPGVRLPGGGLMPDSSPADQPREESADHLPARENPLR